MKVGYTITIGTNIGQEPMSQFVIDALIEELRTLLEVLGAEQFSQPYLGVDLSQFGHWQDEATGETVHEANLIWTGELAEDTVNTLKRNLGKIARRYQQDAIALAIHAGAMLIQPAP